MNPEPNSAEGYDPTHFDHPRVTVDVVLLTARAGRLHTLLIQRKCHPYHGHWALPGGSVGGEEPLDHAARRVLEQLGVSEVFIEQLYTFGAPHRDPRKRVVTVAYFALVDAARLERIGTDETILSRLSVPWEGETGGPVELRRPEGGLLLTAFDHAHIVGTAVKRLRGKLNYTPIGFQLLAETFTLRQLQDVHETVLGRRVNKDSFRRRMLASEQLEPTGESQHGVGHRPAKLYRFARRPAL